MLPDFFIVGAPKAGTTSLYRYLRNHPDIYMSPAKEPNYFSYSDIAAQNLYYRERGVESLQDYEKLFVRVSSHKAIGEASVSYLYYPEVALRIKNAIPDAIIIILLRNPVDRGFSHFLMDKKLGYISLVFEDVIFKRVQHKNIDLYYQQYIELGLYHEQVKRYIDTFGKNRVKIVLTEDMKEDTAKVLHSVFEFLGVKNQPPADKARKHNVYKKPRNNIVSRFYASKKLRSMLKSLLPACITNRIKNKIFIKEDKPALSEDTRACLTGLFADDVKHLETLIERDLSSWYATLHEKN